MRFGIVSTANIGVESVIPAIDTIEHEVAAIASRDGTSASALADQFAVKEAYEGYESMFDEAELDAVYIPLPNGLHAEWTRTAADAGLHVLCEKPLTGSAEETEAVFDYCEERGVTLMEGFMYRFHPLTERAIEVVEEELGDVRAVTSAFTFRMPDGAEDIRLDPDLDGGSVYDVGTYAISAARMFLGEPDRAYATTHDAGDYGVDTKLAGVLEYEGGVTTQISCGFETGDAQFYRVEAENGWLEAREAFVPRGEDGVELAYEVDGRHAVETFDPTDQYRLEVEHFAACVESGAGDAGERDAPRTDADEAVRNMAVIDALCESAEKGESFARGGPVCPSTDPPRRTIRPSPRSRTARR